MSAEADVYTLLSAVPALGGRIYPLVLPQEVPYPAASYQRISAERYSAFGRDALPVDATIQVDVYSMRDLGPANHFTLADDVRGVLQRKSTGSTYDMMITGERDDYEDETNLYRKSYDVRVWYREA